MNKKKERDFEVKSKNMHLVFIISSGFRIPKKGCFILSLLSANGLYLSSDSKPWSVQIFMWKPESFSAACVCEISYIV